MSKPRIRVLLALMLLAVSVYLPPARVAPASAGDFVGVQGTQLMFRGKPIKLKGTNFYPKDTPWADMWRRWKGEDAKRDLLRAQEVGINSIRILVPYKPENGWTNKATGEVVPEYLDELRQMVQMAGELNMKVMIALFDFYDPYYDEKLPRPEAEARNKLYLQGIVSAFKDDDRVMAWDIHNEPDQYKSWYEARNISEFVGWMDRMGAEIRRLDPGHLVTVGMSSFDNLFVADKTGAPPLGKQASGRTVADISDFLSFHSYNVGNMDWQIAYIKGQANKPVVLQETGWPSGPPCQTPDYSEARQVFVYDAMIKAAKKGDLSGLMQWQLWDLKTGVSSGRGRETHEDYFGLLRRDGSWKAAMPLFRDAWPVEPLPSIKSSNLPLTIASTPVSPPNPDLLPPLYFPETGHYIYDSFRDYWRRFGGLEVFGYPLTEVRKEGDYWVQYFERARFEDHPENVKKTPNWESLEKAQKLKLVVQLTRLGADYVARNTGGKEYPRVDQSQIASGTTFFPETGHSISGKIAEYWQANSGLTNFGYPLSEQVQEVSQADGKTYTVQYFERTRLELHPENAGTQYEIQLGLMGRELLASKGCK